MTHSESQSLVSEDEPAGRPYSSSVDPEETTPQNQEDAVSSVTDSPGSKTATQDGDTSSKHLPPPPSAREQWRTEILTCVLMIGMLCAIATVLSSNNGMPLPDLPYHISINAVVSILSTTLKACAVFILAEGISDSKWRWFREKRPLHDFVIFDNASRGPWGCLKLLLSPRGMHPIASLGALLIILTLVLDPFTQQLIRYYDCRQPSTKESATLPRSTMYREAGGLMNRTLDSPIPIPLLGYINQGLYSPADVKTPVVCATGNCTFDRPFSTLGFCSTCKEMSSHLKFEAYNRTRALNSKLLNTALPSGSHATESVAHFVMNSSAYGYSAWIDVIQAADLSLGAVPRDPSRCVSMYGNDSWKCTGYGGSGAARCKFDPCVKTYRARVDQGRLQEDLIHSQLDMFVGQDDQQYNSLAADLTCAGPNAVSRLQEAGFRITKDDVIIPWNVAVNASEGKANIWTGADPYWWYKDITVPGPPLNETGLPLDIIPATCIYSMWYEAKEPILQYLLNDYFNGTLSNPSNLSSHGPPQLHAIYNNGRANFNSINETFANIAESITQRIRRYEDPKLLLPPTQPAIGIVWEQKTCVSVRWTYLAFPITVVALTTMFLVAVVWEATFGKTNNTIAAGWKSSTLPLAFHGLTTDISTQEGTDEGYAGYTRSLTEMERVAKTTKARLDM
ncbi:hypothetical protein PGQ11_001499 [Apiospora arundinis]|uniref:Uncharacterized protein n=1 Tax=Apiospora arundinis TaxID=335852 RepID=A0ABR2JQC8_9PEZI